VPDTIEFVFSFRSPYSWLAARCLVPKLADPGSVQWTPFYPLPSFTNFPPIIEAKTRYLVRDVLRLAEFHGLSVRFPTIDDPNWALPHVGFLEAVELGRGPEFGLAIYAARWERGENVGDPDVVGKAAESVGLDASVILAAALDPERQQALTSQVQRDYDERGIFGVPTLIMPRGTRYWGHDRIEWALREGRLDPAWAAQKR